MTSEERRRNRNSTRHIYIYTYINRSSKFASRRQSELIFSIRPHDGPCREKTLVHRDTHTRERASPEAVTGDCTHNAFHRHTCVRRSARTRSAASRRRRERAKNYVRESRVWARARPLLSLPLLNSKYILAV